MSAANSKRTYCETWCAHLAVPPPTMLLSVAMSSSTTTPPTSVLSTVLPQQNTLYSIAQRQHDDCCVLCAPYIWYGFIVRTYFCEQSTNRLPTLLARTSATRDPIRPTAPPVVANVSGVRTELIYKYTHNVQSDIEEHNIIDARARLLSRMMRCMVVQMDRNGALLVPPSRQTASQQRRRCDCANARSHYNIMQMLYIIFIKNAWFTRRLASVSVFVVPGALTRH